MCNRGHIAIQLGPSQMHRSRPGGRNNQTSNLQEMSELLLNIKSHNVIVVSL